MGLYRKISDFFHPPKGTVPFTEAAEKLRLRQIREEEGKFHFEEDGFTYAFKEELQTIKWSDIERITCYKLDLLPTDEICMEIVVGGWIITFTESTPGWRQFHDRLLAAFPSIPHDWEVLIAQPPFATSYTVLFERENPNMPK